jgi:Raf kinase inhibitor-like YbhB/YbcL family protein
MRTLPSLALLTTLGALAAPVLADAPITEKTPVPPVPSKLQLEVTSSAFRANEPIPSEYTCDGSSATPPLTWSQVPKDTKSVAIFVEDIDAPRGAFTHWLITGISPLTTQLASGGGLPAGAVAAKNSKGEAGYTAPCPPSGKHRYYFHVFALDTNIGAPATKLDFLTAIKGHVLADGQLMGTYQKPATP